MRIWKPVYVLIEKWRFEFYCKWFGFSMFYKDHWNHSGEPETGISVAWKPIERKLEGKSRYVHHWSSKCLGG